MKRTRISVVLFLASIPFLFAPRPAHAAEGDTAFLHGLDSSGFPQMKVFLAASNALGNRLEGLTAQDLTMTEDNAPVRNLSVIEELTGVRLVVVIDPGVELLYTLPEGDTRIDRIRLTMENWLGGLPYGGMDDLTLITPEGTTVSHSSAPTEFLKGLGAYIPKVPPARALKDMLADAVGAVSDPSPRPGMRAFLLVFSASALSLAGDIATGLCQRAMELHATMYGVWSGRIESSSRPDVEALGAIASLCGGYAVSLEGDTGTATVLGAIAAQRTQYLLEFRSAVSTSDAHSLKAAVRKAGFEAETEPAPFSLTIQPPLVDWVDFPEDVIRKGGVSQSTLEYQPDSAFLRAVVTFPDGHPREIAAMQLFADKELVSECTAAPCGGVTWDLQDYSKTRNVRLRIVVRDELGLQGQTTEREIVVRVQQPTVFELFRARYLLPTILLLVILAAFGVFAALAANYRKLQVAQAASELLFPRPGPASVARAGWGAALRSRFIRKPPAVAEQEAESYAVLESLADGRKVEIVVSDAVVGRDASSAICLDDPSVSPRHARIVLMGDGAPWVFDLGSTAGSWRNFEEIPPEGVPLREGDRLNFGRAAFRVSLKPCETERESPP